MRLADHFLSLFRNEFNKFNNTGARMLDSIYHMTFKIQCTLKFHFWREHVKFTLFRTVIMDVIAFPENL